MVAVLRIVEKLVIPGRGLVYTVKCSKNANIHMGDMFYDLRGNKFVVKGIEQLRRLVPSGVCLEDMPIGILFDRVDGVEAWGCILVEDITNINFLFCNHPLYPRMADIDYEEEYCEARKNHKCALFSYEDLENGTLSLYCDEISGLTIYRGWMMKPELYRTFYRLLEEREIILINSPEEYEKYHTLPGWYNEFRDVTVESVWEYDGSVATIMEKGKLLEGSYIVKDFVKSRKHEWYDACYIPNIRDRANAKKIISNFIERQADALVGGIVLRKYEKLRSIGFHDKSGMPISEEYRVFVFAGKIHVLANYWEAEKEGILLEEEIKWLKDIASAVKSNFVTIDLARRENGKIIVMELGDGQVSGLQGICVEDFYERWRR